VSQLRLGWWPENGAMVARVIGVAPGDGGVAGEDADVSVIMVLFCA
jgi:hypothetical protein